MIFSGLDGLVDKVSGIFLRIARATWRGGAVAPLIVGCTAVCELAIASARPTRLK